MGHNVRSLLAGLSGSAVIAASVVAIESHPAAAIGCGTAHWWHNTFNSSSSTTSRTDLFGVRADVDVQQALFCSGGNSTEFTNVYVMSKSSGSAYWAQAGYERQPGNGDHPGIHHFAQINSGSLSTWYSSGTVATGQDDAFKVEHYNDAPLINDVIVSVNGNGVLQSPTSPWGSPIYLELSEEARYREDDVAGTSGNKVNMTSLKFKDKDNDTWGDMPSGIWSQSGDSTRWKTNSVGATHKQFWTDPTN